MSTTKFGAFKYNKKLYTAAGREFFESEDPRMPAGHEPDWNSVVAGPPYSNNPATVERLTAEGYVGLYERLADEPVDIPADDDPRRAPGLGISILMATTPSALAESGMAPSAAFAFSDRVTDLLAEVSLKS
jgi:hypothetical protein